MGIDTLVNQGGDPAIDITNQTIRNDRYWKGFFPQGHVLNAMSSAIFTGFKKEFHKQERAIRRRHQRHRWPHPRAQQPGRVRRSGTRRRHAGTRQLHSAALPRSAVAGLLRRLQDHQRRPADRPRVPGQVSERRAGTHLSHVAPLRLRPNDGGRSRRALRGRRRARRRRSERRLAHGRRFPMPITPAGSPICNSAISRMGASRRATN